MAESIKNQVDALTGFASTEDLALQDWCEAGAKEIINLLPQKLKEKCMAITPLTDGNGVDVDSFGEILFVQRETGASTTIYTPCRKIPSMYGGLAGDSSNMMYYGTATDPVYWIDGTGDASKLYIKPDPSATIDGKIFHVSYPVVNIDTSEIANFPEEASYLVVLYASMKALQALMNDKSAALPSDIDNLILPVAPSVPTISAQTIAAFEGAPTYTPPVSPSIGTLTISASAPTAPTIIQPIIGGFGTAPVYTPPSITNAADGSMGNDTDMDVSEMSTATWTSLDYDFDNENIDFLKWFQVAGDLIQNEEDTELAQAQMQKISTYLNAYSQAMQNKLNIFNDANVEYQAKIQEKLQQAQFADSSEGKKLQKYSAEINSYQAQVNAEVQDYQIENQLKLSKYQTDTQNALNVFNKENVIYQADIQENIQEAQLADAHEARKLQKYQAEVGTYSAEVNSKVQKFGQDLANYNAKMQKQGMDYQWLQSQYAQLKQDYMQGITILKGGGVPQQGGQ